MPSAWVAATAKMGNSSIARTTRSPPTVVAVSEQALRRQVGHRLARAVGGSRLIRRARAGWSGTAPMPASRSNSPVRVGLTPTPCTCTSESGTRVAATSGKAADEKSAGTLICPRGPAPRGVRRFWPPTRQIVRPLHVHVDAKERSMRSV